MSGKTNPRLREENAPDRPEKVAETHAERPREVDEFHPHKHGHVAIATPDTSVTHLDPGAIPFS